jgi:hypothetical protein
MGIIKLFPARETLVGDIPAGDGKIDNFFLQCIGSKNTQIFLDGRKFLNGVQEKEHNSNS